MIRTTRISAGGTPLGWDFERLRSPVPRREALTLTDPLTDCEIYLEIGKKRVFAGAVEWPGWCRPGRTEESAIQALLEYGPRYARALESSDLSFEAPANINRFNLVERLEGNATTDFGAPDAPLANDAGPIHAPEMARFRALLQACWMTFDKRLEMAAGRDLKRGPRGGGRDLSAILNHVLQADVGYLKRIGWPVEGPQIGEERQGLAPIRNQILAGLVAAADGELPPVGPLGGKRWPPRFFVRRVAWHVLDHAWEIEDRMI
jgi:hypothetical protein